MVIVKQFLPSTRVQGDTKASVNTDAFRVFFLDINASLYQNHVLQSLLHFNKVQ